ncbi:Metalloendopeptidase [Aphelenchoides besseyi]|nr:Metalloendopeptidase [Aphelenchoides besseyi]KAI6193145.1 Metalloendopeptidase [Aphelenchoides besseyi]
MRDKPIVPIYFLFVLIFVIVVVSARNIPSTTNDYKMIEQVEKKEDLEQEDIDEEEEQEDEEDHPAIHEINVRIQRDSNIMYGDILSKPEVGFQRAIVKYNGYNRWETNVVPYVIANQFTRHEKIMIRVSLRRLQFRTCFKFPKKTNQRDYVYIARRNGCFSELGRRGGGQLLSLGRGCVHKSIIQHEMMHALGIHHEHQRPDRDNYLKVLFNNVQSGMESQVTKLSHEFVSLNGIEYDYRSIMHYNGDAFGKPAGNGRLLQTLVPLEDGVKLRRNKRLTRTDIKRLNILGNCKAVKNKRHRRHHRRNRKHSSRRN